MKGAFRVDYLMIFVVGFFIGAILVVFFPGEKVCDKCVNDNISDPCNCSINYGGNNMSVEDAFERAGEGLTVDQADEVEILIEEYCNSK